VARDRQATDQIEFGVDDLDRVVDQMAEIAAAGRGWINVVPVVPDDVDVPPTPGPLAVFTARGPAIPFGTWTPAVGGRRPEASSLGIQHAAGTKALERLADAGLALPAGWVRLADHPRRGLVVRVPDDAALDVVLDWLLAAMTGLARVPITGRWLAGIYRR
jgi:hypothetical protein